MKIRQDCEEIALELELDDSLFDHLDGKAKDQAFELARESFEPLLAGLTMQIKAAFESGPLLAIFFSQLVDLLAELSQKQIDLYQRAQDGEDPMDLLYEYYLDRAGDTNGEADDKKPRPNMLDQGPFGQFIKGMDL